MKIVRRLSSSAIVLVAMLGMAWVSRGQSDDNVVVNGFWPLYDFARQLEEQCAVPVPFEAPLLVWRANMHLSGVMSDGTELLTSLRHGFVVPKQGILDLTSLTPAGLGKVLDAYHQANPGLPRYRITQSKIGFHIIPTDARDEGGAFHSSGSVLDAPVNVLQERRTAFEHLKALFAAVSDSTGTALVSVDSPGDWDALYAANGYLVRGGPAPNPEERPYKLFEWGANGVKARDALIDLLNGSATTMSWAMLCRPDSNHHNEQQVCSIGVGPLWVGPQRKLVTLDRCTRCRPVPTLPK